jgi:hypothetical protein
MQRKILTCMSLVMLVLMVSFATAQEKNAIPYPNAEWKGVQGKTLADSKPDFIGQPKGSGGSSQCTGYYAGRCRLFECTSYGGVMRTPTFDRIGDEGIRYTHMSVAAVCSPTRGSLTDRLQHSPDRHRDHLGVCHRLSGLQFADRLHHARPLPKS